MLTKDVAEILQQELQDMAGRFRVAIETDGNELTPARALEEFSIHLERFADVARALDLPALRPLALLVHDNISRWTGQSATLPADAMSLLAEWPLAVCRYLEQPTDVSVVRELLDHMRHPQWARPLGLEDGDALARRLADVCVEEEPPSPEPMHFSVEDLSLDIPADVSKPLLSALLHELPDLTERLAALIDEWADNPSREALNEAQRVAHTIKGAANTVGVRGVAVFTHGYEDLLVALTDLDRPVTATEMHLLRRGAECLLQMSDTLLGRSQRPAHAGDLLREIIDQAKPLTDGAARPDGTRPGAVANTPALPQAQAHVVAQALRIPVPIIDDIFRLAGESVLAVTQMRDYLRGIREAIRQVERQADVAKYLAEDAVGCLGDAGGPTPDEGSVVGGGTGGAEPTLEIASPRIVGQRLREAIADVQELCRRTHEHAARFQDVLAGHVRLQEELRERARRCRMLPAGEVSARLQRGVKQAGQLVGKEVELQISGGETLFDSHILGAVVEPLMHALRNAIDHGIEPANERLAIGKPLRGRLKVSFWRQGQAVIVRCEDDGRGLDYAAIRRSAIARGLTSAEEAISEEQLAGLILQPRFSTQSRATQTSGRGMGMSSIAAQIGQLKGSVRVTSRPHEGCCVEFTLPDSTVCVSGVLVPLLGQAVGVAGRGVERIVLIDCAQVREDNGARICELDGQRYPVHTLTEVLYGSSLSTPWRLPAQATALIVHDAELHCIVLTEQMLAARSLMVRGPGAYLGGVHGLIGTTVLADGRIVPVLDLPELLRHSAGWRPNPDLQSVAANVYSAPLIVIVENSLSAAQALREMTESAGYRTEIVADGPDALAKLRQTDPAAVLVDYDLPTMSGMELIARVRADPRHVHLPMIMVTAHASCINPEHARLAGADALLPKPCLREALLAELKALLGRESTSPALGIAASD